MASFVIKYDEEDKEFTFFENSVNKKRIIVIFRNLIIKKNVQL